MALSRRLSHGVQSAGLSILLYLINPHGVTTRNKHSNTKANTKGKSIPFYLGNNPKKNVIRSMQNRIS